MKAIEGRQKVARPTSTITGYAVFNTPRDRLQHECLPAALSAADRALFLVESVSSACGAADNIYDVLRM